MRKNWLGRVLGGAAMAAASLPMAAGDGFAQAELTVYTAVEAENLQKYAERFNKDHPDIRINWVHDSTGIVTAKLLAEKDNRRADVIWGLAATSVLLLKGEGMLEPYAPAGLDKLDPRFRDKSDPPTWVGMDAWVAAICYNTAEGERLGLPVPKSWGDLTDPVYKGHVTMPNPASSGTGYLDVSGWLQMFGEEDGWEYMDALHKNISQYTHSGSKPCEDAARGEAVIGISFAFRAAKEKADGAPLEVIIPEEGIGWDMEVVAIVKGTDKVDAAKTLVDWSVSEAANEMYNEGYAVIAISELAEPVEYYPENASEKMIDNDFEWAAQNRKRILAEWQRRYGAKSEPKT